MWKESCCQWRCYPLVCWHGLNTTTNRRSRPKFEPNTSTILSWSIRTPLACNKVMQLSKSILHNSLVRRCNVTCWLHVERMWSWRCTFCGCKKPRTTYRPTAYCHTNIAHLALLTGLQHTAIQISHTSQILLEFPFHFLFQKLQITDGWKEETECLASLSRNVNNDVTF
jgi:hypothetical protein